MCLLAYQLEKQSLLRQEKPDYRMQESIAHYLICNIVIMVGF